MTSKPAWHNKPTIIEARVERDESEVALVLVTNSPDDADAVARDLIAQLEAGLITIRLADKPHA